MGPARSRLPDDKLHEPRRATATKSAVADLDDDDDAKSEARFRMAVRPLRAASRHLRMTVHQHTFDSIPPHQLATCTPCGAGRRDHARLCSNDAVDDFGRIAQSIAGEVGVALRGAGISVPEQRLYHIERDDLVDQKARKRVPQVVQPHIGQSRTRANPPPRKPTWHFRSHGELIFQVLVPRNKCRLRKITIADES
jgi:hypothetical protein